MPLKKDNAISQFINEMEHQKNLFTTINNKQSCQKHFFKNFHWKLNSLCGFYAFAVKMFFRALYLPQFDYLIKNTTSQSPSKIIAKIANP